MLLKGIKDMKTKNITFRDAYSGRFLTNCQIKVLKEPNKPIVVEFIQLPVPNYGTTITNTISSLAKQELNKIKNELNSISVKEFIYLLLDKISLNPKDFVFNILKTLCIDLIKSQVKINNIIWVEHYPANTYFFEYDKYAIITFDKTFNEPEWEHISIDELSARTGYDKELFQVNKSLSRKNLII